MAIHNHPDEPPAVILEAPMQATVTKRITFAAGSVDAAYPKICVTWTVACASRCASDIY